MLAFLCLQQQLVSFQKLLLLPFMSLIRLNPRCILVLLISSIPACSDRVSIFLSGHLTLLPLPVPFPFIFQFSQELLAHPGRPPATFASFPAHQDGSFLSLEELILEDQLSCLHISSLHDSYPWYSKQDPEQAKVSIPEENNHIVGFLLLTLSLLVEPCLEFIFF